MPEHLTTQLVAEEMQKLVVAFPGNLAAKTNPSMLADTYRNGLRGLDGDAVRAAVDIVIREDTFFPKIARLREVAGEWTRRNRASYAAKIEGAWHTCPTCGAKATTETITRPKLHKPDEKEESTWYYATIAGQKVKPKDLISSLVVGVPFVIETVEGQRDVMHHNPVAHHIHRGEEGEYQGAA